MKPETQVDARWDASHLRAAVDASGSDRFDLAQQLRALTGKRVNPETVRLWLIGQHEPPAKMFVLLAQLLEADPRALLGLPPATSARASVKRGSRSS